MNIFYHGDCLFVLRHDILPESVELIYLDPPFFTGQVQKGTKKWQPGAMEVSFEDSKRFWKEKGVSVYAPEWLTHIAVKRPDFASYLYYMMERLQACHKVLKDTGSIYLHCDWRASHYLKMVMDEVFGYENLLNEIIWCFSQGGRPKNRFAPKHHTIFHYRKERMPVFNASQIAMPFELLSPKSSTSFTKTDEQGRLYKEIRGTAGEKMYRYYRETGKVPYDWWIDIPQVTGRAAAAKTVYDARRHSGYPTQKPEALLERIIKASSKEGDLVLDPFCGCGTTVIVASKLARRFIGIDIHPTAFEIIKNRAHELFNQSRYISRDLSEVLAMSPKEFEDWVNEFYGANKPSPDKGVDGITKDGIPIQVKTSRIGYKVLSQFITDAKYHPSALKPVKKVIVVSQIGFDNGARQRKFEIETTEGIEISLTTPEDMLRLD